MPTTLTEKTFPQIFTSSGGVGGTVVNDQGKVVPAAAPAFDYDPVTKAPRGLRFRGPARTNLLIGSQILAGLAEGTTPPAVASTTVDGESCVAATFTSASAVGYAGSRVRSTTAVGANVVAGTVYSTSAYVKLSRPLTGGESINVYYTGASGMGGFLISAANSGQFVDRFARVITQSATPVGTGGVYPVVHTAGPLTSNLTVWFCKGQIEAASEASSYIPTTTAAVARSVDQVWIPNLQQAPWFNQAEGTMLMKFVQRAMPATAMLFGITSAASANDRMLVYLGGAGGASSVAANVFRAGVQQASLSVPNSAAPLGTLRKVAASWKLGRLVVQVDELPPTVSGVPALPAYVAPTFWLGQRNGGGDPMDGEILDFAYWPKAANAAEIAAITPDTELIAG
ncbi:hypothetical protein GFK26_18575 [Variovorax paradoxus]|uniref:Uncharacterized protein n=1 Tax=Variovorax paradoxus TaxID=34073 RepID=A0A5Q0M519_VARPD|nr:hypothetical protein [Variovorax paradoxus]QFZ84633.1 hypothetical protein GFK26_18575 [Variovorax paradoxus]